MIYIVIPHYIINEETKQLAKNAIASFQNTKECAIINCDDCSPLKIESTLRNETNKGFGATCNAGFKYILEKEKEDCWVVCANNDIEVFDGWFEEFEKTAELYNADAIGGLGFRERDICGIPLSEYTKTSLYNAGYVSEGGRMDDWLFPGGFYMIRKSLLEECGLYDENFINGYEDIDLFLRWKNAGKRLIMTPKVPYWHKEGATRFSEMERGKQKEDENRNREYFKQKWGFYSHEKLNEFLVDNRINK